MLSTLPPADQLIELLLAEGAISPAAAEGLRTRVRESWMPLGKVLRQTGKVTIGQLFDALQTQSQEPGVWLGEICVRKGYCTETDIENALRLQTELSPHVIDVLVAEKACELDVLTRVVTRYVRTLESQLSRSAHVAVTT
jgi:hypothetical protein